MITMPNKPPKIIVPGGSGNGDPERSKRLVNLNEPIWTCEDGERVPISQMRNSHVANAERWLRGGGATEPPQGAYGMWYHVIRAEFDRRGLSILPDHPNAYTREPADPNKTERLPIHEYLDRIMQDSIDRSLMALLMKKHRTANTIVFGPETPPTSTNSAETLEFGTSIVPKRPKKGLPEA